MDELKTKSKSSKYKMNSKKAMIRKQNNWRLSLFPRQCVFWARPPRGMCLSIQHRIQNKTNKKKKIVSVSFAQKMLRFFYWLRCDWAGVNTIRLRPYIDELRCVCGMWALSLNDIYADADAAIVSVEWTRARAHTQTYENIYIASGGMERIVCVRLCCRPTIIIISMKNTYIL